MLVSLFALVVIAAAVANSLPNLDRFALPDVSWPDFNRFSLPKFNRFAAQPPHKVASIPVPDPAIGATLKDIQSSEQQSAAVLVSLSQSAASQQADLKRITRQLALVTAQLNSLQNAMPPLTTSSIPAPSTSTSIPPPSIHARVAVTSRKIIPSLPKPVGPVSVGGAPLGPAPAPKTGAG
jgi:uncharacterized coiled-coil protein SlyX